MSVSEELLDVVDEDDQVIGVEKRGEIHARGLMHRAVHILVFNSKGDLFLQKRSMSKDENPGLWDSSAAGHVDSGEAYLECARREITEELGIPGDVSLVELFKLSPTATTGYEHSLIYRTVYDGDLILQTEEIDAGEWVSSGVMDRRVDALDPEFTENLFLIWNHYRDMRHRFE